MIPFTQYLLPQGITNAIAIDIDDWEVEDKSVELLDNGFTFDAEILRTGFVSFTCERDDEVVSIKLAENGPPVVQAVKDLVNDSYDKWQGGLKV